jgi:hypothetical protein
MRLLDCRLNKLRCAKASKVSDSRGDDFLWQAPRANR